LEYLLGADKGEFSPFIHLVGLFSGPEWEMPEIAAIGSWAPVIHKIIKRVSLKHKHLNYKIITNFARELFEDFNVNPTISLENWMFPWATMAEAQRYYAALQAIAAYHLLSIHFGAQNNGLKGWGVDQICLSIDTATLIRDIERVSELPMAVVSATTEALILGKGTMTPDPALQPLVPIGCNRLAVLGSVILSSKWSRNMLSLHARVSKDTFDANSAVFEHHMTAALKAELPKRFIVYISVDIPTLGKSEEVDLVLIDERVRSILFGELRWMLQPGDVREVLNRKKVIKEKVDQLRRKVSGARAVISDVLDRLGLPPGDWTINGAVIIEGYGGSPSTDPKALPVVPRDVFVRVVVDCPDLEHAHAALGTPLWLPREGIDFVARREEESICGVKFSRPGFDVGPSSYMRESLDTYLADAFARTINDLRTMPWEAEKKGGRSE
jgi:hypothetical protein